MILIFKSPQISSSLREIIEIDPFILVGYTCNKHVFVKRNFC